MSGDGPQGFRRREALALGAAGVLALVAPSAAPAATRRTAAKLPPRLTALRRRTLGGMLDLEAGGLTPRDRTHAVNRLEYVHRRSAPAVRARVEAVLDRVEADAGGFSGLGLDQRRAWVAAQEPSPGPQADFATVQGFKRFVTVEGATLAAEAGVAGLVAGTEDPTTADEPDVRPAQDATADYRARRAEAAAITRSAVTELRALARTAFDDDPEEA